MRLLALGGNPVLETKAEHDLVNSARHVCIPATCLGPLVIHRGNKCYLQDVIHLILKYVHRIGQMSCTLNIVVSLF